MGGRRLKKHLMRTAAALPVFLANPVFAASPTYNWSGFYAGLTAGATWSSSHETTSLPCTEPLGVGAICTTTFSGNGPLLLSAMDGSFSRTQFTGGADAGYNWQNGPGVYGVEFDLESFKGASRSGAFTSAAFGSPVVLNSSVDADWLFTARGRFGYAFDRVLAYATGGLASTRLNANFSYADTNGDTGSWSGSQNKFGWVVGGGLQWALSSAWSVKAEYLYVNFGSISASGAIVNQFFGYSNAVSTSADLTAQIARAGVNYKF